MNLVGAARLPRPKTPSQASPWVSTRGALCAILAAAFILRALIVVVLRQKQTHDSRVFVSWAHLLMQYGSGGLYTHVDTVDHYPVNYPPAFGLILQAVVAAYRLIPHALQNDVVLAMLLKLPAIAADLVLCCLVFAIVRRWAGDGRALTSAAIAAFAPSTWPISAMWGQVDSIAATLMVGSLALAMSRRFVLAWAALALAVLVKPLPVVIAPLLLVAQLVDEGPSLRLGLGPALSVVVAYVVSLPFVPTAAPVGVLRWLAGRVAGQALSDSTSVNAYNVWTAMASPVRDSIVFAGMSLQTWGWLAFSAFTAVTTAVSFARARRERDPCARERLLAVGAFAVLVALFALLTRMHERYILFALALAPLVWQCGLLQRRVASTLIATFTICVVLVLGFYEHGVFPELQLVTHALSLVNVGALVALAVAFWRRPAR